MTFGENIPRAGATVYPGSGGTITTTPSSRRPTCAPKYLSSSFSLDPAANAYVARVELPKLAPTNEAADRALHQELTYSTSTADNPPFNTSLMGIPVILLRRDSNGAFEQLNETFSYKESGRDFTYFADLQLGSNDPDQFTPFSQIKLTIKTANQNAKGSRFGTSLSICCFVSENADRLFVCKTAGSSDLPTEPMLFERA